MAHLTAGHFEQAIEWADRALHDQPRSSPATRAKIVANAYLGRLDEARSDADRLLQLSPEFTIAKWRSVVADPMAPEVLDLYIGGLRIAGLPEA